MSESVVFSNYTHQDLDRYLSQNKCVPNIKDEYGWTPLMYISANNPLPEVMREALEHGADPYLIDANGSNSFAISAAFNANYQVFETLIGYMGQRDETDWSSVIGTVIEHANENIDRVINVIDRDLFEAEHMLYFLKGHDNKALIESIVARCIKNGIKLDQELFICCLSNGSNLEERFGSSFNPILYLQQLDFDMDLSFFKDSMPQFKEKDMLRWIGEIEDLSYKKRISAMYLVSRLRSSSLRTLIEKLNPGDIQLMLGDLGPEVLIGHIGFEMFALLSCAFDIEWTVPTRDYINTNECYDSNQYFNYDNTERTLLHHVARFRKLEKSWAADFKDTRFYEGQDDRKRKSEVISHLIKLGATMNTDLSNDIGKGELRHEMTDNAWNELRDMKNRFESAGVDHFGAGDIVHHNWQHHGLELTVKEIIDGGYMLVKKEGSEIGFRVLKNDCTKK